MGEFWPHLGAVMKHRGASVAGTGPVSDGPVRLALAEAAAVGMLLHLAAQCGNVTYMIPSVPAWQKVLDGLPVIRDGRWAVGGSAALALHGLKVEPADVDILADDAAAAELIGGLRGAVARDEAPWDRGDVRASRRALAMIEGVEVEILVDVEAVGQSGVVATTPNLDQVDRVIVAGRPIPVLPLLTMLALLEATGQRERAEMVRQAMTRM